MKRFITWLVRTLPRPLLIRLSYPFSFLVRLFYCGSRYECPICGGRFRKMLPFGNNGMPNRLCPKCLSLERHRLMWLYFRDHSNLFADELKLLHIAPEQPFRKRFRKMENLDYTTADLVSPIADLHFDIQDIPLEDNSFDVVICNHVLEHVEDDRRAMREFLRILRPGGWALLSAPIDVKSKTTREDPSVKDPKERKRLFGQYDHLRYHGLDFPERMEEEGFSVERNRLYYELPEDLRDRYRLYKAGEEILYIGRKK